MGWQKRNGPHGLGIALLLIISILTIWAVAFLTHRPLAVPAQLQSVAKNADFQLFYPDELPTGYIYTAGSARLSSGILFFSFGNGTTSILFNEQPAPSSLPNPNLVNPKTTTTDQGTLITGTSGNKLPIAVLLTDQTLISVTSLDQSTTNTANELVQSLRPVN